MSMVIASNVRWERRSVLEHVGSFSGEERLERRIRVAGTKNSSEGFIGGLTCTRDKVKSGQRNNLNLN